MEETSAKMLERILRELQDIKAILQDNASNDEFDKESTSPSS